MCVSVGVSVCVRDMITSLLVLSRVVYNCGTASARMFCMNLPSCTNYVVRISGCAVPKGIRFEAGM